MHIVCHGSPHMGAVRRGHLFKVVESCHWLCCCLYRDVKLTPLLANV